jgi:hypothetical protein
MARSSAGVQPAMPSSATSASSTSQANAVTAWRTVIMKKKGYARDRGGVNGQGMCTPRTGWEGARSSGMRRLWAGAAGRNTVRSDIIDP